MGMQTTCVNCAGKAEILRNVGDYSAIALCVTEGCGFQRALPQGVVDFNDISSTVDKFRNLPTASRKVRMDVTWIPLRSSSYV